MILHLENSGCSPVRVRSTLAWILGWLWRKGTAVILISCFQIIAEGANGPTTVGADQIFLKKNILVIPVSWSYYFSAVFSSGILQMRGRDEWVSPSVRAGMLVSRDFVNFAKSRNLFHAFSQRSDTDFCELTFMLRTKKKVVEKEIQLMLWKKNVCCHSSANQMM